MVRSAAFYLNLWILEVENGPFHRSIVHNINRVPPIGNESPN